MVWPLFIKTFFSCRPVVSKEYQSFELQLFTLELCNPVVFALIYRPPKPNSNFLKDFADFWEISLQNMTN